MGDVLDRMRAQQVDTALGLRRVREARATLGHEALRPVPVLALLHAVRDRVALRAAERPVAFRIVPGDGDVEADADAIADVLVVLVEHAIGVTPRGGRVALTAQAVEDEVVFAIYDAGASVGAGPGQLDRYWARDGAGREQVERTVRAHAGRLWIDDHGSAGNVVLFTVPARTDA